MDEKEKEEMEQKAQAAKPQSALASPSETFMNIKRKENEHFRPVGQKNVNSLTKK